MSVVVDLEGFRMGAGTVYEVSESGIGGLLGSPSIKTSDVSRGHRDGSVAGYDYYDARLITIPVTVTGTTPQACLLATEDLFDAWAPSNTNLLLTITLWGYTYRMYGRPREVSEDSVKNLKAGIVEMTCMFYVPDPSLSGLS